MEAKVLNALQASVLTILFEHGIGERGYYFTGGSALAEFYLQHRYSEDLDLFTRSAQPIRSDYADFKPLLASKGLEIIASEESQEFVRFFVQEHGKSSGALKIEFARDAGAQLSPFKFFEKIVVDSFEDIAVNKVCAILGREPSEPKDFADLYFILQESTFTLDYLLQRAKEKEAAFDREDGFLFFATNLLKVKDFHLLPRMIKPLSLEDLRSFLLPKAEAIIRRLRPARRS